MHRKILDMNISPFIIYSGHLLMSKQKPYSLIKVLQNSTHWV